VLHLAESGLIDGRAVGRALELAGLAPTARRWRLAAERLLLGLGTGLLAAGVICLVAYNWSSLTRWGRFTVAQAVLLLVFAAAWRLGFTSRYGKAALTLATALIGPLLALYGQTYQTGAELSGLFLAWAVLALPWTVASRTASGWLVWLGILEAGLLLHLTFFELWGVLWAGVVPTWAWVCAFNLVALAAWEALSDRFEWLRGRFGPRLIAAALVFPLTGLTCLFLWPSRTPGLVIAPVAWLLVLAGGYVAYRRHRIDLVMLALGWLAVTIVLLASLVRVLGQWSAGPAGWLLGAALLAAASAWGRHWLRNVDAAPLAQVGP
jgi:uncharacterized membrane protein